MNVGIGSKKTILFISIILGVLVGWYFSSYWTSTDSDIPSNRLGKAYLNKLPALNLEHRGFVPPITDRSFWESIEPKPEKLSVEDFRLAFTNPTTVLGRGTLEMLFYPEDTRWIEPIKKAILALIYNEEKDFSSTLGILYTTDLAIVANTLHLLGPVLGEEFVKEQRLALRERAVMPFLSDYERYQLSPLRKGTNPCFWLEWNNNWKAVCLANIVYIAWIVEDDPKILTQVVNAAQEVINDYLNSFESDGYFSGGMRYWGYGFSHYGLLSEMLLQMTQGLVDLYKHPTVSLAVTYPYQLEISGTNPFLNGTFPVFGDNRNPPLYYEWVGTVLPQRFSNLWAPGSYTFNPLNSESFIAPYLMISPYRDLTRERLTATLNPQPSMPYSQLAIFKDPNSSLILVIKGGHNGEEHNHNDVGSYNLFCRLSTGLVELVGDLGVEDYMGDHFAGGKRYTFEGMGSHGHPLPIVNNLLQSSGHGAYGVVVPEETNIDDRVVTWDLTACYQDPNIEYVKRRVSLNDGVLSVRDSFKSSSPVSFETVIPTRMVANNKPDGVVLTGFGVKLGFDFQASSALVASDKNSDYFQYAQFFKLALKAPASSGFIEYKLKLMGPN